MSAAHEGLRAIVLRAAGTNCDREAVRALELEGAQVDLVHLNRLVREPERLDEVSLLLVAGGFSYGDYVAAGRVFGHRLRKELGDALRGFVARGGYVLGICNGFQILVDTGLLDLPACPRGGERSVSLYVNESDRFECRWVTLRHGNCGASWLEPDGLLPVPMAHAEGRIVLSDPSVLDALEERGQVALRYVHADGGPARGFPDNPNGSAGDIAGLCDPTGRVLGLMPHPERNLTPWNHPLWTRLPARTEGEGRAFFRALLAAARDAAPLPTGAS